MAESIVSGAAAPPPGAPSFSYLAVFSNCPLVAAVLAFAIAQSIKVLTTWYKENRWDAKQLVGSGGMPSSHSATVTALAVAVGLQEGFASSLFATTAVFASVVGSPLRFPPLPFDTKNALTIFGRRWIW
uniref:Acid phosphatase/vanadium-dependent haloperoxidase-related protein n=1 Tax=Zea mays TaxID=4577 RepID=C0PMM2_MAIZE|nr:unknown [Zea mays]